MIPVAFIFLLIFPESFSLVPPLYQWSTIDFAWEKPQDRVDAIKNEDYIPEHNMPNGLARWKNKLFISIPRWKKGVPSSLNYILIDEQTRADPTNTSSYNCSSTSVLHPYPSWKDGFVQESNPVLKTNATVVSTFRMHVDKYDRLWVVDNGVMDLAGGAKFMCPPSVVIFDLKTDELLRRFPLPSHAIKPESAFTSIIVDTPSKDSSEAFAYITDMGSDAIVVYNYKQNTAWRVDHPFFKFEPEAAKYKVGNVIFYWKDGVSSAALGAPEKDQFPVLYFQPTSSTKQFKMSTRLLRNQDVSQVDLMNGIEVVGDRGMNTQATACAYDQKTNVLFFTQVNKNGFGCWDVSKPFNKNNVHLLMTDCTLLEFPNDIKVDDDRNLWVLSNRQSKFLYRKMNSSQINFRILTAPVNMVIQGTPCERKHGISFHLHDMLGKKRTATKRI